MRYAWYITKDQTAGTSSVGLYGPNDAQVELKAKAKRHGRPFRLTDADGTVMYYGRIHTEAPEGSADDFGPLDDFGRANGCTGIQYRDGREWVEL